MLIFVEGRADISGGGVYVCGVEGRNCRGEG